MNRLPAPAPAWPAGHLFAHRGWHGPGRPENSLAAIRAAAQHGWGVELDVRLSADGEAMVIHDSTLWRVAGDRREVRRCTAAELGSVRLRGSEAEDADGGGVPRLAQVCAVMAGRGPLLVEVKAPRSSAALDVLVSQVVAACTRHYEGGEVRASVISFDPRVAMLVPMRPGNTLTSGQSIGHRLRGRAAANLGGATALLVCRSAALSTPAVRRWRARGGRVAAWTVTDPARAAALLADGVDVIAEGDACHPAAGRMQQ